RKWGRRASLCTALFVTHPSACMCMQRGRFTKLKDAWERLCRLLNRMKQNRLAACAAVALWTSLATAQTPAKSVVGTVSVFKAGTAEIEIKPDNGEPVAMKVTADTIAQKVAPGVTDLKK